MVGQTNQSARIVDLAIAVGIVIVLAFSWLAMPADVAGLMRNTSKLAACILLLALPVASVLAYAMTKCSIWGRRFWEGCLLVLLFFPLFIQLASWEAGFGRGGWYSVLIARRLSSPPLDGFRGAVLVHVIAAIPWLFWIIRFGLMSVPRRFEESASLDATRWQVFRKITLPLALPVYLASVLYVLIVCSTEITVTDRFQFRSYAEELYNQFVLNTSFETLPLGAAPVAVTMICVIASGVLLCRLLLPTLVHATVSRPASTDRPIDWVASMGVGLLTTTLLFLPLANLLYQVGIDVEQIDGQHVRFWSLSKLLHVVLVSPYKYRKELAWSVTISQFSVIVSVALATLLCWWANRHRLRQAFVATLGIVCFVTPGPFVSLGLIWLLNRNTPAICGWLYDDTVFAPWMALTIRSFPYALLIIWFGFQTVPRTLVEAAAVDGASPTKLFRFVMLPMLVPSLICASLVSFAVSMGELSASALVLPPGVMTTASRIFNLIHYGAEDELAGLCLSCIAVMIGVSLLARNAFARIAAA